MSNVKAIFSHLDCLVDAIDGVKSAGHADFAVTAPLPRHEIEELVRENRKLVQEKDGLNSRLGSLRGHNKQLEKKVRADADDKGPKAVKRELMEAQGRVKELEEWATELEDKLSFTVDKFEEQNQRFMECGKELAES